MLHTNDIQNANALKAKFQASQLVRTLRFVVEHSMIATHSNMRSHKLRSSSQLTASKFKTAKEILMLGLQLQLPACDAVFVYQQKVYTRLVTYAALKSAWKRRCSVPVEISFLDSE
jgi:hypothetical protein